MRTAKARSAMCCAYEAKLTSPLASHKISSGLLRAKLVNAP
jgi:hypothetical protein